MGVFKSSNPVDWTQLDDVYIDELSPPGKIIARGTGKVGIVGQFQKGPFTVTEVTSSKQFKDTFGGYGASGYGGYKAVIGKKFRGLKVCRIEPTGSLKASRNLFTAAGSPNIAVIATAASKGAWGNDVQVSVLNVGVSDFDLAVRWYDTSHATVLRQETFENCTLDDLPSTTATASNRKSTLVDFTKQVGATQVPGSMAYAYLTGGSDGTVAAAAFTGAIDKFAAVDHEDVDILIAAEVDSTLIDTVNAYLKTHVDTYKTCMTIINNTSGKIRADVVTDVASYRSDRVIYTWPHLYAYSSDAEDDILVHPNAFYASLLSQLAVHKDPAIGEAVEFLSGVRGLEYDTIARGDYILLQKAGISAFIKDRALGYKIKSGVTCSLDSAELMIHRRRMTDWLAESIADRLVYFNNSVNYSENWDAIKGEMLNFIESYSTGPSRMLPNKTDVSDGIPYIVDINSLNDDDTIANGEFHILYKQRIFSSMRFIVLHIQCGEGVLVQEVEDEG